MREPGEILIVSCYELGHQPLAAASALGFFERAGYQPVAVDLAVEGLETLEQRDRWRQVRLVAISVPMHTALHIGVRAARRLRLVAPQAHICFYGLYAILNAEHLLETGLADSVTGGEFEESLVDLAAALDDDSPLEQVAGLRLAERPARPLLKRLAFPVPSRGSLPELGRYAKLEANGETRLAAAVETSRGCLHLCRHCPIPPVYAGRFFVVPRTVVLEDIRQLVRDGATHITFSDPDFFNGPGHALGIVRAMHKEFPELTFDITTKVEHILKHRTRLDELAACGCAFIVSAVESLSNTVLRHLMKGHTKEDVFTALSILRSAGIPMRPSLVAFTPWTRLEDYQETLRWVDRDDLIRNIDLVQFSIRLLIPPGSPLAELDAMQPHLVELKQERFSYIWKHPDPRMDHLHGEVSAIVHNAALHQEDSDRTFERIWDAAFAVDRATSPPQITRFLPARTTVSPPRLTEPWFC
ncbi:MAG: CUAEP/CCAEP-tail radical SAM (seleno)protein [Planctomycetota bacterium]